MKPRRPRVPMGIVGLKFRRLTGWQLECCRVTCEDLQLKQCRGKNKNLRSRMQLSSINSVCEHFASLK